MKENKEIMDEKITKIGTLAIECLNGRDFNKLILGLIINKANDTEIRNMEFFYKDSDDKLIYFNEFIHDEKFNDSIEEEKYLELQELLFNLHEYCADFGDEWQYMTLIIDSDGKFNINFEYDSIEIVEWRKQNGIIK